MAPTPRQGAAVDLLSQRWVVATGRRVDLAEPTWLDGPIGSPEGVGDRWIAEHATRVGATVSQPSHAGPLIDLAALDGPGFDAAELRPAIRDSYERTAAWELDAWARWSRWAEPGGRAIAAAFSRRVRQLSLPLDPLDVAQASTAVRSGSPDGRAHIWARRGNERSTPPARRCSAGSTAWRTCRARVARPSG